MGESDSAEYGIFEESTKKSRSSVIVTTERFEAKHCPFLRCSCIRDKCELFNKYANRCNLAKILEWV